jgi:hypothetical protein
MIECLIFFPSKRKFIRLPFELFLLFNIVVILTSFEIPPKKCVNISTNIKSWEIPSDRLLDQLSLQQIEEKLLRS